MNCRATISLRNALPICAMPKGDFHAARLLHVEVVHEDALRRFGAEVDFHRAVGGGAHFGGEHEVELPHVRPVLRAADGIHHVVVHDDGFQAGQVVFVHGLGVAGVYLVALGLVFEHAGVRLAEHGFVEACAEPLGGFLHFFFNLFIVFGHEVLDEHIGAVAFLAVSVVDERVVEGIDMPRSLPGGGVHEDGRVDAHHVFVEHGHRVPPIAFDVVLQFHAVLPVVVHGTQPVVYFTRREHETILLAVRNELFEYIFLCHIVCPFEV